jgi:hypothetical protein
MKRLQSLNQQFGCEARSNTNNEDLKLQILKFHEQIMTGVNILQGVDLVLTKEYSTLWMLSPSLGLGMFLIFCQKICLKLGIFKKIMNFEIPVNGWGLRFLRCLYSVISIRKSLGNKIHLKFNRKHMDIYRYLSKLSCNLIFDLPVTLNNSNIDEVSVEERVIKSINMLQTKLGSTKVLPPPNIIDVSFVNYEVEAFVEVYDISSSCSEYEIKKVEVAAKMPEPPKLEKMNTHFCRNLLSRRDLGKRQIEDITILKAQSPTIEELAEIESIEHYLKECSKLRILKKKKPTFREVKVKKGRKPTRYHLTHKISGVVDKQRKDFYKNYFEPLGEYPKPMREDFGDDPFEQLFESDDNPVKSEKKRSEHKKKAKAKPFRKLAAKMGAKVCNTTTKVNDEGRLLINAKEFNNTVGRAINFEKLKMHLRQKRTDLILKMNQFKIIHSQKPYLSLLKPFEVSENLFYLRKSLSLNVFWGLMSKNKLKGTPNKLYHRSKAIALI